MWRPCIPNSYRTARLSYSFGRSSPQWRLNMSMMTSRLANQANDSEHYFRYTSGRWLYDEAHRLKKRYLKFDVDGLKRTAANTRSSPCVKFEKLPEGLYNKVFSIGLEDGTELIARLPNPNAGHAHYVVASEVATLDFLRNVVGIPVPRVLSWSSKDSSPGKEEVGAEYMIMERAPGRQLSTVWPSMSAEQHLAVAKGIVGIEQKLTATSLREYGSIYHQSDSPSGATLEHDPITLFTECADASKFTIGPVTEHSFWSEHTRDLKISRGPWNTPLEYFTAIVNREIALIRKSGDDTSFTASPYSASYCPNPTLHVELLQKFLAVLPSVLPPDEDISRATLWHCDLHADNIFVDDEDPTKITCIIDRQNVWAAPLFMQAGFPSVVNCPWPYPQGAVMPKLPENYSSLSDEEKLVEEENLQEVKLKKYYEIGTRRLNNVAFRAMDMMEKHDDPAAALLRIVGLTWTDGPVPLQELLIQVVQRWEEITQKGGKDPCPCPISFTAEEIKQAKVRVEAWSQAFNSFEALRYELLGKDGWASHEDSEEAMRRLDLHRGQLEDLRRAVVEATSFD